jgi:hypothetical protein
MRSLLRVVVAVLAIVMLAGVAWIAYGLRQIQDPATRRLTLKSGRVVEVIWAGVLGKSKPAWVFEYHTRIPIRNEQGLRHEVELLWPEIEEQAEHAGMQEASVRPVSFAISFRLFHGRPAFVTQEGRGFGFEKNADGVWKKHSGWELEH